jgi:hypothetical protein
MSSFELELEPMLLQLSKLSATSKANWGKMSAQRMVEHLADALYMSIGEGASLARNR